MSFSHWLVDEWDDRWYINRWFEQLVAGLEPWNFMTFPYYIIGNFIIPTDELHHFSEG